MPVVPNALAGAVTVVALVGGGVFFYPWLLGRRGGAIAVAAITAALTALFYYFDRGSGTASAAFALLWAAAPAAVRSGCLPPAAALNAAGPDHRISRRCAYADGALRRIAMPLRPSSSIR